MKHVVGMGGEDLCVHVTSPTVAMSALRAPSPHVVESFIEAAIAMAAWASLPQWILLPAVPGCAVGARPFSPSDSDPSRFHRWLHALAEGETMLVAQTERSGHQPSFAVDVRAPPLDAPNLLSAPIVLPRAPRAVWALWAIRVPRNRRAPPA